MIRVILEKIEEKLAKYHQDNKIGKNFREKFNHFKQIFFGVLLCELPLNIFLSESCHVCLQMLLLVS